MLERAVSSPVADADFSELSRTLERLIDDPALGLDILHALAGGTIPAALRGVAEHLSDALDADIALDLEVDAMVSRAVRRSAHSNAGPSGALNELLAALSDTLTDDPEELARAAVSETGRGNIADKTIKNQFASRTIFESLINETAQGVLSVDADRRVTELASPVGVVFAVSTDHESSRHRDLQDADRAEDAKRPHPQLPPACARRQPLLRHDRPRGALLSIGTTRLNPVRRPGIRKMTTKFMRHRGVSLILATGGAGLVRAAYSSATPAIGVGPGNAPAWICDDADIDAAAAAVVTSKTFDNGMTCGAEHNLVVDASVALTSRRH